MQKETFLLLALITLLGCKVERDKPEPPKNTPIQSTLAGFLDFKWDMSKKTVTSLMKNNGKKSWGEKEMLSWDNCEFGGERARFVFYFHTDSLYNILVSREDSKSSIADDIYKKYLSAYKEKYGIQNFSAPSIDDGWLFADGNKILLRKIYNDQFSTWFISIDYINGRVEEIVRSEEINDEQKKTEEKKKKLLKDI